MCILYFQRGKFFSPHFRIRWLTFIKTPRESLEFIIRSYGGEAIIDDTMESSTRITHQIVDRDFQKHRYLNREYMQPQWVYDSINVSTKYEALIEL